MEGNLNELLTSCKELSHNSPPGLLIKPPAILHESDSFNLPRYEIVLPKENSVDITIQFDLPDDPPRFSIGSSINPMIPFSPSQLINFKHDFVFRLFTDETDVPFKTFFPILGDKDDDITPDLIRKVDDTYIVVEFSTRNTINTSSLKNSYDLKSFKYDEPITRRLSPEDKSVYIIIVVGINKIYTNFPNLSDFLVNELCFRYLLATSIEEELINLHLIPDPKSIELQLSEKRVLSIFKQIPFDFQEERTRMLGKVWDKQSYEYIAGGYYDEPHVDEILTHSFQSAISNTSLKDFMKIKITQENDKRITTSDTILKLNEKFKDLERKFLNESEETGIRLDNKACVQLPFLLLKESNQKTTNPLLTNIIIDSDFSLMHKIFTLVNRAALETDNFTQSTEWADELSKTDWETIVEEEQEIKVAKSMFQRVALPKLTITEEAQLAKVGVLLNKTALNNSFVTDHRIQSKNSFKMSVDTDDIENFLFDDIFRTAQYDMDDDTYQLSSLIEDAINIHDNSLSEAPTNYFKRFRESALGRYSQIVTEIGVELCLSVQQHCKGRNVVYKKLKNFDLFLILKPTSSEKHLFVSFLWHEDSVLDQIPSTVFKKYSYDPDSGLYVTDFVSFNRSKLVNLVTCHSRMLSLHGFFQNFYSLEPWNVDVFETPAGSDNSTDQMFRDLKLCLLIQLCDKDEVEEELTRLRYVMMEGFVSFPKFPQPCKLIKKLNKFPRSRLTVYLIKQSLRTMRLIHSGVHFSRTNKRQTEEALFSEEVMTEWVNLFHPIFQTRLEDPGQLINLFYLGYLNNKEKTSEVNADSKLFTKIIEEEVRLGADDTPGVIDDIGVEQCSIPKAESEFHHYDPDLLTYMTKKVIQISERVHGKNFLSLVEKEILRSLSHLNIEKDLTTLKASSLFSTDNEEYTPKELFKRTKVITNCIKNVNNETTVMELIPRSLAELEEDMSLHIDLFKKQQHGGLREIYVLGFHERVVQLVIETVAKTICKFFNSETMTSPEQKNKIPSSHMNKTNMLFKNKGKLLVGCSDDAERWNQRHYSSKFYHILVLFTPKYMHPLIHRILRLWMRKKIRISQDLLDVFQSINELNTMDHYIKEMFEIFKWPSRHPNKTWYQTGKNYILIRTGMMQGILHYNSSLLHTILQEFLQDWLKVKLTPILGPFVCSVMQSSDDSAMLISVQVKNDVQIGVALYTTELCFEIKNQLGKYLSIYRSIEKSTVNTPHLLEFNSQFFFGNSRFSPHLKNIIASTLVSEQESLLARQEEQNTQITDIIQNGGSFWEATTCQMSQALLNYLLIGQSVSRFFVPYCRLISRVPDPNAGFFLFDNPLCPGILGFSYNHWLANLRTDLGKHTKLTLVSSSRRTERLKYLFNDNADFKSLQVGSTTRSVIIPFGNRKKWSKMIEEAGIDEEWEQKINKMPVILYTKAKTKQELDLKIAHKLHSPGVSKSFDGGNLIPRIIASSVYIINQEILKPVKSWYEKPWENLPEDILSADINLDGLQSVYKVVMGKYQKLNVFLTDESYSYSGCHVDFDLHLTRNQYILFVNYDWDPFDEESDRIINNRGILANKTVTTRSQTIDGITLLRVKFPSIQVLTSADIIAALKWLGQVKGNLQDYRIILPSTKFNLLSARNLLEDILNTELTSKFYIEKLYMLVRYFPELENSLKNETVKSQDKYSLMSLLYKIIEEGEKNNNEVLTYEELKFFFPYSDEYNNHLENLSRISGENSQFKYKIKRRVATSFPVYLYEREVIFSPDVLIGDVWFGLDNVHASKSVKLKLFNNLEMLLPWLSRDPEETLLQSPFDNHTQLRNWLARTDLKSRTLKILGVPVNSRSGITNLNQLISENYSRSYKLTLKLEVGSTEEDASTRMDLKHMLMMICKSPFLESKKKELVEKTLSLSSELTMDLSRLNSRTNMLALIQKGIKYGFNRPDFLQSIYDNNLGFVGSYIEPQKFNIEKGIYEGRGVWKGKIGSSSVLILLEDSSIKGVIVDIRTKLSEVVPHLKTWSQDNQVTIFKREVGLHLLKAKFRRFFSNDETVMGYSYNGKITSADMGFPIFNSKTIEDYLINTDNMTFELDVTRTVIKILMRTKLRSGMMSKPSTILRYKCYDSDFLSTFKLGQLAKSITESNLIQDIKIVTKSFIFNEPLLPSMIYPMLKKIGTQEFNKTYVEKEFKIWVREMYLGSIHRLGFGESVSQFIPDHTSSVDSDNAGTSFDVTDKFMALWLTPEGLDMSFAEILKGPRADFDEEDDEDTLRESALSSEIDTLTSRPLDIISKNHLSMVPDYIDNNLLDDFKVLEELNLGFVSRNDEFHSTDIYRNCVLLDSFLTSFTNARGDIKHLFSTKEFTEGLQKSGFLEVHAALLNEDLSAFKTKEFQKATYDVEFPNLI